MITLDSARIKFVANEALNELYVLIDEWYNGHGCDYHTDERVKAREQRHQELGLKSLEHWKKLLTDPDYELLRDALKNTFVFGRLGSGHVSPSGGSLGDLQSHRSLRVGQGGAGKTRNSTENGSPPASSGLDPDRPGDLPLGVIGPRGNRRRLVKADSIGLQLWHEPLDSPNLWELDSDQGILFFNTSHRLWERVEAKDSWVLKLQEWLIMQVLYLLTLPSDQFADLRQLVDVQLPAYIELYIRPSPIRR